MGRGLYNGPRHAATREDVRIVPRVAHREAKLHVATRRSSAPSFTRIGGDFRRQTGAGGLECANGLTPAKVELLRAALGELGVAVRRVLWQVERVCRRALGWRVVAAASQNFPKLSHRKVSDSRAGRGRFRVSSGSVYGRFRDQKGSERDRFGTGLGPGFLSRSQRVFGRNAGQAGSCRAEGWARTFCDRDRTGVYFAVTYSIFPASGTRPALAPSFSSRVMASRPRSP